MRTHIIVLGIAIMTGPTGLVAQEGQAREKAAAERDAAQEKARVFAIAGPTFEFVAGGLVGKPVKGAPYSAEAVTETTQVLGDGNRIFRTSTAMLYRDSEGRERREQALAAIGPWQAKGGPEQTVFISDPVAKLSYVLNPNRRTAHKMPAPAFHGKGGEEPMGLKVETMHAEEGLAVHKTEMMHAGEGLAVYKTKLAGAREPRKESLGKQMVEGVEAEGTRITIVIPAGEIGNERPIEIVEERWYSPELKTMVMSRHSDPRTGETLYKLTRINRSEPLRSLFEVPQDYTVTDPRREMKIRKGDKTAQPERDLI